MICASGSVLVRSPIIFELSYYKDLSNNLFFSYYMIGKIYLQSDTWNETENRRVEQQMRIGNLNHRHQR